MFNHLWSSLLLYWYSDPITSVPKCSLEIFSSTVSSICSDSVWVSSMMLKYCCSDCLWWFHHLYQMKLPVAQEFFNDSLMVKSHKLQNFAHIFETFLKQQSTFWKKCTTQGATHCWIQSSAHGIIVTNLSKHFRCYNIRFSQHLI